MPFFFFYDLHLIETSTRALTFINHRKFIFIKYRSFLQFIKFHFLFFLLIYTYLDKLLYNVDPMLVKSPTHIDICPPLGNRRRKYMFVQHWLRRITSDRLSIYLTISLVRKLYVCACQLVHRSVNNIELFSFFLFYSIYYIRRNPSAPV